MADASTSLAVTNQKNAAPTVPGAVDFTAPTGVPGSSTTTPVIPGTKPPNVTGGQASFSSVTSALSDLIDTRTAELSAGVKAIQDNVNVDVTAAKQISGLTDDTLNAMQRVQRIKQFDGFAPEITQILGIFDKDWSIGYQAGRIDMNETKAKQISATATVTKEMNNQMPALLAKATAGAQAIFNAQKDANQLAINQRHEDTEIFKAQTARIEAGIHMSQEQRAATEFRVNSMTTDQAAAVLEDINKKGAKSKFAGIGGFVQHRLTAESQAIVNLDQARAALEDKNIDLFGKKMTTAASLMPPGQLQIMIDQAEKKGESVINIPTEVKGPDGKPKMIPMPLKYAKDGIILGMQTDEKANQMVSADLTQKANIIPRITYLTNTAQSFVGMDNRAANVFAHVHDLVSNINSKDPASIARVDGLLKQQEAVMKQIVKENAEKFPSKAAQSAIIVAGENGGKFDAVGGTAVAVDSVGVPGFNTGARYSAAWGKLNLLTAQELSKQGLGFNNINDTSDGQSQLAMILAGKGGHEKIAQVAKNIFADPQKMAPIRDEIKGKITDNAIGGVFSQLSQGKNANPLWANLANQFHNDGLAAFHNEKGQLNVPKLMESMEQATLLARAHGNKTADYSANFIQGLQKYAASGGDSGASDPTYSISDRALEAALFNGDPSASVLGSLHFAMRQVQAKIKAQFQQRIQEDLNGTTQRNAYTDMVRLGQIGGAATDAYTGDEYQLESIAKKTGKNLKNVPSATGTGLTVSQVQQIMSTGQ